MEKADRIPNRSGVYSLYDRHKRRVYVGRSRVLRHRLQSYVQKDNLRVHRTKGKLRRTAKYFSYRKMGPKRARTYERRAKRGVRFNYS
ncbi:MAG: GIY-YIG nuclease family protein [Candidatus Woesearchaeota archaeon]